MEHIMFMFVFRIQSSANCLMIGSVVSTQYTRVTDRQTPQSHRAMQQRRAVKNCSQQCHFQIIGQGYRAVSYTQQAYITVFMS